MSRTQRIVVIDDEADIAHVLALAATSAGHSAIATSDPARVVKACIEGVDLVVLDLCMPGIDGVSLLHAIAAAPNAPRVILMSGLDDGVLQATRRLGEHLGLEVGAVLPKPFGIAAFIAAVGAARRPPRVVALRPSPATLDVQTVSDALQEGRVEVFYQPQVALETGLVVGAEALVRLRMPDDALVGPDHFLDAVRTSGLMRALTLHVLEEASNTLARIVRVAPAFVVSVNVPVSTLASSGFVLLVLATLASRGLAGRHLTLEITEDEVARNDVATLKALLNLRLAGVRLSIDDFGAGHSTLVQTHRVPANELKIDKAFVGAIMRSTHAATLVRNVVRLGHELGMRVVAEGVETEDVADGLRSLGCEFAQGFLFGRAMHAGALVVAMAGLDTVLAAE
jgi:EAL domain-containing protein (putative c-di-GMP-specific phosphodiesterase class I)/ActR/RegA family two-component response regulator